MDVSVVSVILSWNVGQSILFCKFYKLGQIGPLHTSSSFVDAPHSSFQIIHVGRRQKKFAVVVVFFRGSVFWERARPNKSVVEGIFFALSGKRVRPLESLPPNPAADICNVSWQVIFAPDGQGVVVRRCEVVVLLIQVRSEHPAAIQQSRKRDVSLAVEQT